MIFDSPDMFPNSCVLFTKFKHFELRHMFAYLREREETLQKDVTKLGNDKEVEEIAQMIENAPQNRKSHLMRQVIELVSVQRSLIWMTHNVTGSPEERALRRRGFGSEEHSRQSNVTFEWNKKNFQALLRKHING